MVDFSKVTLFVLKITLLHRVVNLPYAIAVKPPWTPLADLSTSVGESALQVIEDVRYLSSFCLSCLAEKA